MGRETLRGSGAACVPPGSCVAGGPGQRRTEGGRVARHAPRWARGCAPVRAEHLGQSVLPHQAQRDGRSAAGLLRELGADARAGRLQPRPGAALRPPPGPRSPRARRLPPRAGDRGTGPLGRADRPWRRGRHLHRATKPPQHGQRPGHHAGPLPRRQAPAHGRLRHSAPARTPTTRADASSATG